MHKPLHIAAFTLIELLIVIAIIAILSIVVILVLNPAQLLQQARDSNRVSDMSTLNTALGVYQAQGGSGLGSSSVVYVSIPDPMATTTAGDQCQGLGLLSLPANYTYHCAATSTYRAVDGTGWVPVNFSSISTGAPLGELPIDPINTSSSREYYTYETNGTQYEVTMVPESQKYQLGGSNDVVSNDGGILASVYEKGSATGLEPLDYGDPSLVGYWPLNEGTGTVAYDMSGNNATGSWSGTAIGSNGTYYTNGKGRGYAYAGDFDGSTDYVDAGNGSSTNPSFAITISAWVDWTQFYSDSGAHAVVSHSDSATDGFMLYQGTASPYNIIKFFVITGTGFQGGAFSTLLNTSTWYYIVGVYDGADLKLFINGVQDTTVYPATGNILSSANHLYFGTAYSPSSAREFNGFINDVRIYNRALSASEIAAMYADGK